MKPPTTYGEIIAAAHQALEADLPERDIVKMLRRACGVSLRNPYKPAAEKLTGDMRQYMRDYHARRRAAGRCNRCGQHNDRAADGPTCTRCLERNRITSTSR